MKVNLARPNFCTALLMFHQVSLLCLDNIKGVCTRMVSRLRVTSSLSNVYPFSWFVKVT